MGFDARGPGMKRQARKTPIPGQGREEHGPARNPGEGA